MGRIATTQKGSSKCVVRLDRLRFSAEPRRGPKVPAIEGFSVLQDFRARPQGKIPTYARVKKLRSETTSSAIDIQHKPQQPWLKPCTLTAIGDDKLGISPEEVEKITAQFRECRLSLVELAFDFDRTSGIDEQFVRRYCRFGKSRRRKDRGGPGELRFGSRGSPILVRCYQKQTLACYRVELEVHATLLRRLGVKDCRDLYSVASKLIPSHLCFVGFRWGKLARSLTRRFGAKGTPVFEEARRRRDDLSLRDALRFLSKQGVPNPHRFLKELKLNNEIKVALRGWAERFSTLIGELPTR